MAENRPTSKSKFIDGEIKWHVIYGNQDSIEVLAILPNRGSLTLEYLFYTVYKSRPTFLIQGKHLYRISCILHLLSNQVKLKNAACKV